MENAGVGDELRLDIDMSEITPWITLIPYHTNLSQTKQPTISFPGNIGPICIKYPSLK